MRAAVLALVCAACSKPPSAGPRDAGDDDAAVDAPVDAITNRVTITLYADDGSDTPIGGAKVLAHDRMATLAARTTTAADGTASIDVPFAGSVTVVRDRGAGEAGLNATTVYDLEAPLHLNFGWKTPSRGAVLGGMGVVVPLYPGATSTTVFTGCDAQPAGGGFAAVHFYADCQRPSYDFVAIAYAADGTPLASAELDAQSFSDGGVVAIPASFTAAQPFAASIDDVPISQRFRVTRTERRDGLAYSAPVGGYAATPGPLAVTVPIAGAGSEMEIRLEAPDHGLVRDRVAAASSDARPAAGMLDTPYLVTVVENLIQWGAAPDPRAADGVYVRLETARGGATTDRWLLIATAGHAVLVLPRLPPDVTLVSLPGELQRTRVGVYDSDRFPDYAAFVVDADREHMVRFSELDPSRHLRRAGQIWP